MRELLRAMRTIKRRALRQRLRKRGQERHQLGVLRELGILMHRLLEREVRYITSHIHYNKQVDCLWMSVQ